MIGKNNRISALNDFYGKRGKIYPAYVLKHNSICEKEVILLMIPKGRSIALYYSKKNICIIKRYNV